MTGDKPLSPIPPPLVPLAKLAEWLQEMHGLTESEMRDLLVDLRAIPLPFRLLDGSPDENTPLESWEDLEVENEDWWAGRARWKQYPGSSYFPLVVAWSAVTSAVNRLRKRQERLALEPPAGVGAHPAAENVAEKPMADTKKGKTSKTNKGGPPTHLERDDFDREVVRRLTLDGGNLSRTQLRKDMKQWASDNMKQTPDPRTVERWIDRLVLPGLLHD